MNRRMIAPILIGLLGGAILLALGIWQLQRMQWKEGILARIAATISAPPVALPATPDPQRDAFLPVRVSGRLGDGVRVLASTRDFGPGYRIIRVLTTAEGRRVLVDLGFLMLEAPAPADPEGPVTVTGNLHWPDEVDSWTPAPEIDKGLWFARDLPALARQLKTEPVLIVAREVAPPMAPIRPLPVGLEGIPNNHLNYAITWFLMALAWLGMTGLWLWRIRRRTA